MKNKIFLLLTLISICAGNLIAQRQIHYSEAVAVARNMLNYLDYDNNSISDIAEVRVYVFQESDTKIDTLLYEVELANGAEILLSGNRACKPVLAHGYSGSIFRTDEYLPCGMEFFLDSYIEQIEFAFTFTDTLFYLPEWEELKIFDETQIGVKGAVVVAPLLSTEWGQGINNCWDDEDAYNYYVDETHGGAKCYAGCVAVAMGQIMNYWKCPVWTPILNRQFDWCNMVDRLCGYNNDDYDTQKEAVSWLLFKCGKAINMDYCSGNSLSSSASISDARDALVNKFGYSSDADIQSKWLYNMNTWTGRIRNNINNGWPVLYTGENSVSGSGHAFVCDGYNNNDEFHFNFGWNNSMIGSYFALDALNPDLGHNYSNTRRQKAVFYIYPSGNQDYCSYTLPLETAYYSYYFMHQYLPFQLLPHQITPKTFSTLASCPETSDSTWRIIPDTAITEYVAHKEVILRSGFKVRRGAEFSARIAPCPNCENAQMPQMRNVIFSDTMLVANSKVASNKLPTENDLTLYPNPATQILTLSGMNSLANLQIYDNRGAEVRCWKVVSRAEDEIKINVVQLPTGTYILRATKTGGKTHVGKFVKQ